MREIKFRAWNKEMEEMLSDVSILNDTWDMLNEFFKHSTEVVWMQYTGLKDKNGIEIYEGDILLYHSPFSESNRVMVCEWSGEDGVFIFGGTRTDYAIRYGEVIGNIYENQDLIK